MAKTRSWSVKGIDGETRDLARDAARASGMTIGAWIDQAILSAKSGELPIVAPGNVTGHTPAAAPTNTRAMAEPELPMSQAPAERPGEAPPNYATPEVTPPDVTAPGQEVPAPAIKSNPQTVTDTDSASTTAEQDSNIGESISGESISGENLPGNRRLGIFPQNRDRWRRRPRDHPFCATQSSASSSLQSLAAEAGCLSNYPHRTKRRRHRKLPMPHQPSRRHPHRLQRHQPRHR